MNSRLLLVICLLSSSSLLGQDSKLVLSEVRLLKHSPLSLQPIERQFIEIYNPGPRRRSLIGYRIALKNGYKPQKIAPWYKSINLGEYYYIDVNYGLRGTRKIKINTQFADTVAFLTLNQLLEPVSVIDTLSFQYMDDQEGSWGINDVDSVKKFNTTTPGLPNNIETPPLHRPSRTWNLGGGPNYNYIQGNTLIKEGTSPAIGFNVQNKARSFQQGKTRYNSWNYGLLYQKYTISHSDITQTSKAIIEQAVHGAHYKFSIFLGREWGWMITPNLRFFLSQNLSYNLINQENYTESYTVTPVTGVPYSGSADQKIIIENNFTWFNTIGIEYQLNKLFILYGYLNSEQKNGASKSNTSRIKSLEVGLFYIFARTTRRHYDQTILRN